MRTSHVVVKKVPEQFVGDLAQTFLGEIRPCLSVQRPRVVLDFSEVSAVDRRGVRILLQCLEEALKRNGDVKLAALPPELAVALQQTGFDQICDAYDTSKDAVDSYFAESYYSGGWATNISTEWASAGIVHASGD